MSTVVKRFKIRSTDEAEQYVAKLRRQGRSAWTEQDGDQSILCLRMETVRVRVLIPGLDKYYLN